MLGRGWTEFGLKGGPVLEAEGEKIEVLVGESERSKTELFEEGQFEEMSES